MSLYRAEPRAVYERLNSFAALPKGDLEKGLYTSARWSIDDNAMGDQDYVSVMTTRSFGEVPALEYRHMNIFSTSVAPTRDA